MSFGGMGTRARSAISILGAGTSTPIISYPGNTVFEGLGDAAADLAGLLAVGGRDGQLELMDLNPGEKVKGWVSFALPESATPASIKFELPGETLTQAGCSR
jgi:hypothetical protein